MGDRQSIVTPHAPDSYRYDEMWRPCSGVIVYILDASTTSIPGSGSVIVEALLWRNCKYSGCSLCNRKVDETEL